MTGCWNGATGGTNHAWMFTRVSSGLMFGLLWILSLTAYVKQRGMQKIYYRFIAWMIPLSWVAAVWALIAFIVGGVQEGGEIGKNIGAWFLYAGLMFGFEMVAYSQAPKAIKFYRWD